MEKVHSDPVNLGLRAPLWKSHLWSVCHNQAERDQQQSKLEEQNIGAHMWGAVYEDLERKQN